MTDLQYAHYNKALGRLLWKEFRKSSVRVCQNLVLGPQYRETSPSFGCCIASPPSRAGLRNGATRCRKRMPTIRSVVLLRPIAAARFVRQVVDHDTAVAVFSLDYRPGLI